MTPYYQSASVTIYQADSRTAWQHLPECSADAIVTSPPYFGLRDYGVEGQIGLEDTPEDYIHGLADLLTGYGEGVLRPEGSLWLNLGDTYNAYAGNRGVGGWEKGTTRETHRVSDIRPSGYGLTAKDWQAKCLLMIPERVVLALIERGWILRNKVVWAKPNGMPSSVTDRLATKWEYVFHLVRQQRYHYDLDAIRQPAKSSAKEYLSAGASVRKNHAYGAVNGAPLGDKSFRKFDGLVNPGDVWQIPTQPYPETHFAVYPPELVRRPILATVPEGGTVLDPFFGSGTTGVMAHTLGRRCVGVEINEHYCAMAADRLQQEPIPWESLGARP